METEGNVNFDEVGHIAKMLDTELTIFERMNIKKSTVKKMFVALGIYSTIMFIFAVSL